MADEYILKHLQDVLTAITELENAKAKDYPTLTLLNVTSKKID